MKVEHFLRIKNNFSFALYQCLQLLSDSPLECNIWLKDLTFYSTNSIAVEQVWHLALLSLLSTLHKFFT